MGITERRKGKEGELEVARILRATWWPWVERTSRGTAQAERGDIAFGPKGCHIEIKRQEKLNVPAAIDQATRDAKPGDIPIVVHRPSRHPWYATLPLDDLLPLLALRERG